MHITGSQLKTNIKRLANSKGYSLNELCDVINLTRNGFDYSIKNMTIKLATIIDIAKVLDVDYRKIIEGYQNEISSVDESSSEYGKNFKEKYYELLEENRELRMKIEELRDNDDKKKEAS